MKEVSVEINVQNQRFGLSAGKLKNLVAKIFFNWT